MNPILIIGGLAIVVLLLEKAHITIGNSALGFGSTPTPPVVSTGIRIAPFGSTQVGPTGLQLAQQGTNIGLQAGQDIASSFAEEGSAVAGAVSQAIPLVGAALQPIFSLLAAHTARVKGAKTENQALNQVFPAMQADITSVLQAYSAGQISEAQGETALQQILENYWNAVAPFEHGPGQAGGPASCIPINPPDTDASKYGLPQYTAGTTAYYKSPCDKTCTVSCCAGCNTAQNWIATALNGLRNNRLATLVFRGQVGSSYGWTGAVRWSYTFKPQ